MDKIRPPEYSTMLQNVTDDIRQTFLQYAAEVEGLGIDSPELDVLWKDFLHSLFTRLNSTESGKQPSWSQKLGVGDIVPENSSQEEVYQEALNRVDRSVAALMEAYGHLKWIIGYADFADSGTLAASAQHKLESIQEELVGLRYMYIQLTQKEG